MAVAELLRAQEEAQVLIAEVMFLTGSLVGMIFNSFWFVQEAVLAVVALVLKQEDTLHVGS